MPEKGLWTRTYSMRDQVPGRPVLRLNCIVYPAIYKSQYYSCTNNLYKIISNHNKNLIEKSCVDRQGLSKPLCNCRDREECPVGGKCKPENVEYKATICSMENKKDIKIYFRISTGNWKQMFYSHRHSFSNPSLRNQTALSKRFWSNFRSKCNLCLEEKISIIKYKNTSKLLNQSNELIFKCRHENRYKLMRNDFRL